MHIYGKISLCGFLIGVGLPQYFDRVHNAELELNESLFDDFDTSKFEEILRVTNFNSIIYFFTFIAFSLWIVLQVFHHSKQILHESIQVFLLAAFLGAIFSIGLIRALVSYQIRSWHDRPFSIYLCIMAGFHFTEYLFTSITNPANLDLDSFVLNHSVAYTAAAIISWLEYGIESYYFPRMKICPILVTVGLVLCVAGEILRKLAMLTASTNFSHLVQSDKVSGHELVTGGVYSWCRHPAYAGWFIWSIGTQIVLLNPISFVAYAWASWKFFYHRIRYEEATLVVFFGAEYTEYQKKTKYTGVPCVPGYLPTKRD